MNFWALVLAHRIRTEIAKLQLHSTGARLLPSLRWVPCSHDGPREMTTAFDVTGSGSWSKRSSLSVYHTHAAIDLLFINTSPFSSLCFAWKFCCAAWSPGWVLKLDSGRLPGRRPSPFLKRGPPLPSQSHPNAFQSSSETVEP